MGTVIEKNYLGCIIKFKFENVTGQVTFSNMKRPNNDILSVGDTAKFLVINFSKQNRLINVKYHAEIN